MKWTVERRKIKELYEYAKNPRTLSKKQGHHLNESLDKFGQRQPIVINPDGTIIGGHQRLRTLKKLGYKEVDVSVPNIPLSEKEVEELNIRLNRVSGSWDDDILANAWDPADLVDWGFSMEELHLEQIPGSEPGQDGDKQQSCSMTIHFDDAGHLQEAENRISVIVDEYPGARYKVKVK